MCSFFSFIAYKGKFFYSTLAERKNGLTYPDSHTVISEKITDLQLNKAIKDHELSTFETGKCDIVNKYEYTNDALIYDTETPIAMTNKIEAQAWIDAFIKTKEYKAIYKHHFGGGKIKNAYLGKMGAKKIMKQLPDYLKDIMAGVGV